MTLSHDSHVGRRAPSAGRGHIFNFSGVSQTNLAANTLRRVLNLLPSNLVVPILQGRLRGKFWKVGSGVNGYWLGSYEWEKRLLFEQTIKPGNVVFDIGANVGFYTLLASELSGPGGRVFAFEPLPRNLHYLTWHVRRNRARNVTIFDLALSDAAGTASFDTVSHPSIGRLSERGSLTVQTDTLDHLVSSGRLPSPDVIKMDIEGGELDALHGARETLATTSPTIFLATHSAALHAACSALLTSAGYHFDPVAPGFEDEILARKR